MSFKEEALLDEKLEALMDMLAMENHLLKSEETKELHDIIREARQEFVGSMIGSDEKVTEMNSRSDLWCSAKHAFLITKQLREAAAKAEKAEAVGLIEMSKIFYGVAKNLFQKLRN